MKKSKKTNNVKPKKVTKKPVNKIKPRSKEYYGWTPDIPDHRDLMFSLPKKMKKLPRKVDLRTDELPVYDQGALGSCFHPETKIPLLNGKEYTIKELSDGVEGHTFWVYSINEEGKMVPGKATAQLTGINKELIKVILDNNYEIICTPDHKFMKRNGEYIEAKDLKYNDSLMPLYRKMSDKGYELVMGNNDNKYHYTHWNVAGNIHESEIKKIKYEDKKSVVIHHINFDKNNNIPENLQPMGWWDHSMLHAKLSANSFKNWNGSEKQKKHSKNLAIRMHKENPGWNKKGCSKGGKISWETIKNDEEKLNNFKKNFEKGRFDSDVRKKAKEKILKTISSLEYKEKQSIIGKNNWEKIKTKKSNVEMYHEIGVNLGKNSGKNKIIIWAKELLDENGLINESLWNEKKKNGVHNFSKYKTIFKYFETIEELTEAAYAYNHKVKNVEYLDYKSDVYCLTVEKHQNFALSAGVYVHNCTANAIATAFAYSVLKQEEEELYSPSRLFTYYNTRLLEGNEDKDSGATLRSTVKVMNKVGVCDENFWPYTISKFKNRPTDICYKEAVGNKAIKYERLNRSLPDFKSCLAAGFPFVGGFAVYESFETREVTKTGKMVMPNKNEQFRGGHAIIVMGYDDDMGCFIVRNSWGVKWGDKGHFYMPYEYLLDRNLSDDFWVIQKVT